MWAPGETTLDSLEPPRFHTRQPPQPDFEARLTVSVLCQKLLLGKMIRFSFLEGQISQENRTPLNDSVHSVGTFHICTSRFVESKHVSTSSSESNPAKVPRSSRPLPLALNQPRPCPPDLCSSRRCLLLPRDTPAIVLQQKHLVLPFHA